MGPVPTPPRRGADNSRQRRHCSSSSSSVVVVLPVNRGLAEEDEEGGGGGGPGVDGHQDPVDGGGRWGVGAGAGGGLSCRRRTCSVFLLVAVVWLVVLSADLSHSVPIGSYGVCPLQQCWDAYYGELERLGFREDFHKQPVPLLGDQSRSQSEWRRLCVIYRAFSTCVQNASRACVGDLNFHSTQRGVERKVAQYNCTIVKEPGKDNGAVDGGRGPNGVGGGGGNVEVVDEEEEEDEDEEEGRRPKCVFHETNISSYRHCAMHGDPHLRTLGGQYQTCRIHGAWPFIDNDYLTIQITSEPIGVGEGTSITKVTVVIKRNDLCALDRYVTYQAQNGELPSTFDDGLVEFNSIEIFEFLQGRHIEIDIDYKQTTIIIRLTGLAYSVSVSLPEEIYAELERTHRQTDGAPVQLCLSGCPSSERVDLYSYFGQKPSKLKRTVVMAKKEATDRCRGLRLRGFYFDSCVYDLMTTGDSSFMAASHSSYSDMLRFVQDAVFQPRNTTFEDLIASSSSGTFEMIRTRVSLSCSILVATILRWTLSFLLQPV